MQKSWYSNMVTNFKFRIFLTIFFIKVNIIAWININRLHFNCAVIFSLDLFTISSNLSIYTVFDTDVIYIWILIFIVVINQSFNNNRFSFVMCWINFYSLYCNHDSIDVLLKLATFDIRPDSPKSFWKALVIPFFLFQRSTPRINIYISIYIYYKHQWRIIRNKNLY